VDAYYFGLERVRLFYGQLLQAMPDLQIEVRRRHLAAEAIILEVFIRGRHLGAWRGLRPTGRSVEFPLCGIYTFDENDRLAGEKIYYDRATVLRQLGVFHEPGRLAGRVATVTHPVTMARIVGHRLFGH
jgi:predicted ester cyclase